jgi:hypothetical protein
MKPKNASIIRRKLVKEKVQIVSMTIHKVEDGYDFHAMSDNHIATGAPDGHYVNGWNCSLKADVLIDTKGRMKGNHFQFLVPSFLGEFLIVDKEEYCIVETGWRGQYADKTRRKAVISIIASRYQEAKNKVQSYR